MTPQNLRILYKQETGEYPPEVTTNMSFSEILKHNKYMQWLKEELIISKVRIDSLNTELISLKNIK